MSVPVTFEEHWASANEQLLRNDTPESIARRAWDAAIESKKPQARVVPYKGYDVVENTERFTINSEKCNLHFGTRDEAAAWGRDNGFRMIGSYRVQLVSAGIPAFQNDYGSEVEAVKVAESLLGGMVNPQVRHHDTDVLHYKSDKGYLRVYGLE
jgi:hypothetical protein